MIVSTAPRGVGDVFAHLYPRIRGWGWSGNVVVVVREHAARGRRRVTRRRQTGVAALGRARGCCGGRGYTYCARRRAPARRAQVRHARREQKGEDPQGPRLYGVAHLVSARSTGPVRPVGQVWVRMLAITALSRSVRRELWRRLACSTRTCAESSDVSSAALGCGCPSQIRPPPWLSFWL